MKKSKIFYFSLVIMLVATLSSYFYLIHKNNIDIKRPSTGEIKTALDKSINWVLKNQDELLQDNNPVLWWFLDESAALSKNDALATLVRKYRTTILDSKSVWSGYWVKKPPFIYITGSLNSIEDYQKFFVYSLTCDDELGEELSIQKQLNINFCNWKPYYSSCSTHQLMGIRLLQIKNCGDQQLYGQLSVELADIIENQLIWDPRVGDVYIQRVLMLLESGFKDKVKPIWIHRIIEEQRENGGWANFYKLFNITDKIELGFGYVYPAIRSQPDSSFHATAQAIYLLSLVASEDRAD